mmetsp:Transcript_15712/g.31740  ORF Transcript_15712/g.31740 Transcript_15712/m.31740 type:complete len:697 (-) Transcript_15712:84-2174(-)|eukprot:CAMPEP_0170368098 /NCGR_PEP_ID=MMETSP0117_2-20130122/7271_1 /TAXON_ID=400756 /ORGANISM="Durinskia baltica, Strain CSIRO CS-38" /LENGTH=696 /DNA_ID=CAMNT_0010622733 /DNA_START=143 /DNA_END=2233 /DNA_ORIENTATION=-
MESDLGNQFLKLATAISFFAFSAGLVFFQNKRVTVSAALRLARRKKKELGNVNIGAIFGMDVGGTLTKIVYFEAKPAEKKTGEEDAKLKPPTIQRGSSESLAQLDCPDHQEALANFYTFMDNNKGLSPRSAVVRDEALSQDSKFLNGKLHFLHFETRNMVDAIKYVSSTAPIENIHSIGCTGGGAHKFAGEFEEELDITFNKFDELECLVRGMHFALNNFPDECFTYRPEETVIGCEDGMVEEELSPHKESKNGDSSALQKQQPQQQQNLCQQTDKEIQLDRERSEQMPISVRTPSYYPQLTATTLSQPTDRSSFSIDEDTAIKGIDLERERTGSNAVPPKSPQKRDNKEYTKRVLLPGNGRGAPAFPYLVVNIGSGVSILKVTGPGKAERVSGTSLGGGTYWGLCRLLTGCESYEEVLDFAERGDASVVDMLVRDIYGGEYAGSKLTGSMVASSFGKLVTKEDPRQGVREEDLALALLMMITNNIGQVAYLVAQLQKCSKIFFVGNFLRQNPISCRRLAYAISFWSAGKMEAMFLMHEGHYGALGTFLASAFGDEVDRVISINNIPRMDQTAVGGVSSSGCNSASESGLGSRTGSGKNLKVDGVEAEKKISFLTQPDEIQYMDHASNFPARRNLRGRSFSEDIATRTLKDRYASLSPKSSSSSSSSSFAAAAASAPPSILAPSTDRFLRGSRSPE